MKCKLVKAEGHWRPDWDYRYIEIEKYCCATMENVQKTYNWLDFNADMHDLTIPIPSSPDEDDPHIVYFCPWCGEKIEREGL